jgi:hypothetical protein
VLPTRLPESRAREIIANPSQLFAPAAPLAGGYVAAGGGSATDLTIQDAAHAHASDSLTLSTDSFLAAQDAAHAHAADNVTLSISSGTDLVVQDAAHAHAADNLALTLDTHLSVADAAHSHTAENLDLTVTGSSDLTIQDATHAHSADNVDLEIPREATGNNFAGPRVIWKGRINKRWWLRDDEEEDEAPKAIKKAAKAIEKLAEEDASPAKVEKILAPILNSAPRINWQAYFDEVAANIAAQNAAMREAHRIQLAYIVAQAARVAQDEDDIEALLLML